MNVLSLFDGMSCGRIALDRLGIKVDNYYASEIDKYAIQVSQANYPDIIQVGDVTELDTSTLPKIDLIMGGSPCQGFSFAGKQLAFDDPRSTLFFEFVRCVKELKPKYFLLENVRMKKEYLDVISEYMGVEPIMINSALVSAQNRVRFYWTNILGIEQPEQRGIVLRDILETETNENPVKDTARNQRHYRNADEKSLCMTATMYKGAFNNGMTLVQEKPIKVGMNVEQVKVRKHEVEITSLQYLLREMKKECGKTNKQIAKETVTPITKVEHWFRTDSSFAIPSDDIWIKLKEVLGIQTDVFDKQIMDFEYRDGVFESTQRVYSDEGKSPTLTASNTEQMIETSTSENGITNIKKGTSGKSWFFEQQTYSKDSKKTRSLKSSSGSGNIPKVLETKPKQVGIAVDIKGHDQIKRVYSPDGKSPTVNTCQGGNREPKVALKNLPDKSQTIKSQYYKSSKANFERQGTFHATGVQSEDLTWRKLTPLECERLQTVPDNYTNHVSNTQRYKMLGNGWTIEVICHILKKIKEDI